MRGRRERGQAREHAAQAAVARGMSGAVLGHQRQQVADRLERLGRRVRPLTAALGLGDQRVERLGGQPALDEDADGLVIENPERRGEEAREGLPAPRGRLGDGEDLERAPRHRAGGAGRASEDATGGVGERAFLHARRRLCVLGLRLGVALPTRRLRGLREILI